MSEGANVGDSDRGWLTIGDTSWWARVDLWFLAMGPALLLVVATFVPIELATASLQPAIAFLTHVAVVGVLLWLALVAFAVLNPVARINLDRGLVRSRGRTVRFEDIDVARRPEDAVTPPHLDSVIWIGASRGPTFPIAVLYDGRPALEADEQAALIELIERSNIRLPESRFDPTGKFARYNFLTHLDKAEAADAVRGIPRPQLP